jgi:hypothetical protein
MRRTIASAITIARYALAPERAEGFCANGWGLARGRSRGRDVDAHCAQNLGPIGNPKADDDDDDNGKEGPGARTAGRKLVAGTLDTQHFLVLAMMTSSPPPA